MRLKSWKELQEKYFKQYLCGRYLFNYRSMMLESNVAIEKIAQQKRR
jgi:hypothetical protein